VSPERVFTGVARLGLLAKSFLSGVGALVTLGGRPGAPSVALREARDGGDEQGQHHEANDGIDREQDGEDPAEDPLVRVDLAALVLLEVQIGRRVA